MGLQQGTSQRKGCGTSRIQVLAFHAKPAKSSFPIAKLQVSYPKEPRTGVKEGLMLQNTNLEKPF